MHAGVTETMNDVLRALTDEVNAALEAFADGPLVPPNMREAVRYALLGPGKRLRPGLVLLCADVAGGSHADALAPAVALELIHGFSLVHDDLPAMDDDDLRRGRPTLHIEAGEAMAILTGDVMVSLAMSHLARASMSDDRRVALVREIADATTAMIRGQVDDTLGRQDDDRSSREQLDQIHADKTAALIIASCRCGAIAADADDATIEALADYGEAIGMMFQAVDDLLDETQTTEHLGKASGKDQNLGKLTAPHVLGLDGTRERIAGYERKAREAVAPLGPRARPLLDLVAYMANRTR
ncbi:MAG: polyprenyl synthetase family protein [Planctomycetota bacterium]